jgi:type II secretory pathway component PulK
MRRTLGEIIITILMAVAVVVVAAASSSLQEVETFLRREKLLKLRELFCYGLTDVGVAGFTVQVN